MVSGKVAELEKNMAKTQEKAEEAVDEITAAANADSKTGSKPGTTATTEATLNEASGANEAAAVAARQAASSAKPIPTKSAPSTSAVSASAGSSQTPKGLGSTTERNKIAVACAVVAVVLFGIFKVVLGVEEQELISIDDDEKAEETSVEEEYLEYAKTQGY